jgi:hypothetical protein
MASSKVDLGPMLADHLGTLKDDHGKWRWGDVALFYGLPILVGVAIWLLGIDINSPEGLLTAFSVLVGLLFNLLVLIFDIALKLSREQATSTRDQLVLLIRQTQANTTYALVLGLGIVTALGVLAATGAEDLCHRRAGLLTAAMLHFMLTLLMVVKRVRATFQAQFV